jgi:heme/copper-type cytochrome/quinol oxidase subunit 2
MNPTAMIFMAGAWIFVLGLTFWSFWKLMSTPQDEKLPPPGSVA